MKKNISLAFSLLSTAILGGSGIFAQQQPYHYDVRVTYEMTCQPDSMDKGSATSEFFTLLVGENQSVFCASQYLVMDSAIASELGKGNTFGPPMSFFMTNGTRNSTVIFKSDGQIMVFDQAARFIETVYKFTEPQSGLNWSILGDTLSVAGIVCQKAETIFGNRKWIAWFAPSIPISDGPYKFSGLPGLILKVNDVQGYWNFDISSLSKTDTVLKVTFLNHIPQPIKNKDAFLEQRKYTRDNRYQIEVSKGDTFSDNEAYKRGCTERALKDNNWIELYKNSSQ